MTPPRRKLLFYTHALESGGAERVVAMLASGFAERGCDVTLAVDRHADVGVPLAPGVRVAALGDGHGRSLNALTGLIRAEKPDASFSALSASNLKHALAAARAGRGARAVISFHGYFEAEPQLLSRIGFLSMPIIARLTARTVCVSDGLLAHARRFGAPASRLARIFNPVRLADAAALAHAQPLTGRAPLVLGAGRLAPIKGFGDLIAAFARVAYPGARLRIVGDGDERPALIARIADLGLQDRVELAGRACDMHAEYRAARCFALTSHSESFGNVAVEALSHGLPVIATDCGGPAEIVNDRRCGEIAPIGDLDAIAQAIDRALTNPGDPAPRQARASAFAVEKALDAYQALFDDVVATAAR